MNLGSVICRGENGRSTNTNQSELILILFLKKNQNMMNIVSGNHAPSMAIDQPIEVSSNKKKFVLLLGSNGFIG
jgi:hypothetical protein